VTKMDTNMNNWMKVVMLVTMAVQRDRIMLVTMAVQRDRISMVTSSATKMAANMYMLVTMAVQRDRVSMVTNSMNMGMPMTMSSVSNVDTTANNHMTVVILVTMAVQRVSKVMGSAVMLVAMAI
jgi:hypothetical protein